MLKLNLHVIIRQTCWKTTTLFLSLYLLYIHPIDNGIWHTCTSYVVQYVNLPWLPAQGCPLRASKYMAWEAGMRPPGVCVLAVAISTPRNTQSEYVQQIKLESGTPVKILENLLLKANHFVMQLQQVLLDSTLYSNLLDEFRITCYNILPATWSCDCREYDTNRMWFN